MERDAEHGAAFDSDRGDVIDTYAEFDDLAESDRRQRESDNERLRSAGSGIITFATALAIAFSRTLTVNDRVDVNFIALLLRYVGIAIVIYGIKTWTISYKDKFHAYTGEILYEILQELYQFLTLLYSYIIIALVLNFFNITIDDTTAIIILFIFYSLFTKVVVYYSANKKFVM
jgi:hypothetical protein